MKGACELCGTAFEMNTRGAPRKFCCTDCRDANAVLDRLDTLWDVLPAAALAPLRRTIFSKINERPADWQPKRATKPAKRASR
jgi:hypothetical protein